MVFAFTVLVGGLILLFWSAHRFVCGAAAIARHFGMPMLLIGMVIVGFGTSMPEMVVSAIAALQGNPGIALGNAYGSNITNIALILGLTAVLTPIAIHSRVVRLELPILAAATAMAAWQVSDGRISRLDAAVLLMVFAGFMAWSILNAWLHKPYMQDNETEVDLLISAISLKWAVFWLVLGLLMLTISSRLLVWGAVDIARRLGVSDLMIGLTIVAIGTSMPELASTLVAVRKGEHDIAVGNIIGSNLFNTLAVVGIAGMIHPFIAVPEILNRDMPVMGGFTLSLFILSYRIKKPGGINHLEGALLLTAYLGYITVLIISAANGRG